MFARLTYGCWLVFGVLLAGVLLPSTNLAHAQAPGAKKTLETELKSLPSPGAGRKYDSTCVSRCITTYNSCADNANAVSLKNAGVPEFQKTVLPKMLKECGDHYGTCTPTCKAESEECKKCTNDCLFHGRDECWHKACVSNGGKDVSYSTHSCGDLKNRSAYDEAGRACELGIKPCTER